MIIIDDKMTLKSMPGECREKMEDGCSQAEIIVFLHDSGLSLCEAIKTIVECYGISLGEAKTIVASHPVWKDFVKAHEPFHDELEKMFTQKTE